MKTGNLWQDFEWQRATDGYQWKHLEDGLLLVPNQDDGKPLRVKRYKPLSREYSGLGAEFAALEPTADAVLAFANRYGQLGWPLTAHVFGGAPVSRVPAAAEFDAWDWATGANARPYPGIIGEFLSLPSKPEWERNATWTAQIRMLAEVRRNHRLLPDVPQIAASLQAIVNLELKETVGPSLSWSTTQRVFRLRLWPKSLAGALWLQAALAVALPLEIRKCIVCETPIEVSRSGGARTDAMFCSQACKSKDYRERGHQARKLHAKGQTVNQIAKRLRAKEKTVRGWLRARKENQ